MDKTIHKGLACKIYTKQHSNTPKLKIMYMMKNNNSNIMKTKNNRSKKTRLRRKDIPRQYDLSTYKINTDNSNEFVSFTLDLPMQSLPNDEFKIMKYLGKLLRTEIVYVMEHKKANGQPHIHGFFKLNGTLKNVNKIFYDNYAHSYHYNIQKSFWLEGWVGYITKESNKMFTTKI